MNRFAAAVALLGPLACVFGVLGMLWLPEPMALAGLAVLAWATLAAATLTLL